MFWFPVEEKKIHSVSVLVFPRKTHKFRFTYLLLLLTSSLIQTDAMCALKKRLTTATAISSDGEQQQSVYQQLGHCDIRLPAVSVHTHTHTNFCLVTVQAMTYRVALHTQTHQAV